MSPETTPSEIELNQEKEKDKEERRRIIIALLFLLLSFSCIFCSSQSALWLIDRSRIEASMLSTRRADYGADVSLGLAPLEGDIAAEAEHDEALLLLKQTPIAGGLGVVILPNPLPTPAPTVIALLPTPTPTPTVSEPPESGPSTPPLSAPTSTSVAPPPTSLPPTSPPPTSPPPTSPPPTAPPPTVPPTSPPPTAPPPTVPPTLPPPTVPPPTSPPPTSPPPTSPPPTPPIPPSVQFSSSVTNMAEGDIGSSLAMINVTLSAASAVTVTVNYATSAGTATAGSDYTGVSGTLIFSPGQTNQTFAVSILGDTVDELDETVILTLSAPTNATLGVPNPATLTITDDDAPPTVQFSSSAFNVTEGDVGSSTATINVTLSTTSTLMVTVDYTTNDLTATAGDDYTAVAGILIFNSGQSSQTFDVPILGDTLDEPNETLGLALSNPTNATLGVPNPATLTIEDDDTPATCPGLYPAGEPNIGSPNGTFARIACDVGMIIDLGTPINTGHPGFDLVYYEIEGASPPTPGQIKLDWVVIEVGQSPSGPWYQVFYWGDATLDTNTNIGQAPPPGPYGPPENDNTLIPMTTPPLYGTAPYTTGIAIDIDVLPAGVVPVPAGTYQYVRIYSPPGGPDGLGPEVDAVEVLP